MCASVAAAHGRSVMVLEHNDRPGAKIRISGGGRCNFTNIGTSHRNFISRNPEFCRSALARYTPRDFIDLVDSYGIAWHEKTLGQLFCDGSAQQIIDMLVAECNQHNVGLHYGINVRRVTKTDVFHIETTSTTINARNVVIATGGLSIPKLGASDVGYRIARHFGLSIVPPEPALVPVTFDASFESRWGALSGVSVDAVVSAGDAVFRENLLFTHRGLSGPAILQASSYWHAGEAMRIDLLPEIDSQELFPQPNREHRTVQNVLSTLLPRRVVEHWDDPRLQQRVDQLSRRALADVLAAFHAWSVQASGTEGYAKAEVTRGGIDTYELSQTTMECRRMPGLYAIGEVVDVTGWLGGYNFQWAWASAVAAGKALQ
ncbi:MAG: NAD(P)/FAD-dependent oxidoreductase [Candidatus Kapabacteria bacterium]|nr:NAD(P)/FAD-dependent oxidoreductase [Candidatus Kapabacteria bacterium]